MTNKLKTICALVFVSAILFWFLSGTIDADQSYEGREPDAPWRASAQERIEKYRKGDIEVTVVDETGKPVPGATVTFAMKRHLFRFGTVVTAENITDTSPVGKKYREEFLTNFNTVALARFYDFMWHAPKNPKQREALTRAALQWLSGLEMEITGHVLVWNLGDSGQRRKVPLSPREYRERVQEHFQKTIEKPKFSEHIDRWDLLNEPTLNNEVFDALGRTEAVEWFKQAHRIAPHAELMLNETRLCATTHRAKWLKALSSTEELVKYLQENGAPIHAVGIQSHHVGELSPIPAVVDSLERLSRLKVNLLITEYDTRLAPSAGKFATFSEKWRRPLPEPMTSEMEILEADYLRDYLTACFSQPQVKEFTMWGFWDGDHWLHNAPLYRKDWTLKPGGEVWQELTKKTWWTDVQKKTNQRGQATIRGFLGDYDVTVKHASSEKKVSIQVLNFETPTRLAVSVRNNLHNKQDSSDT